MGAFYCSICKQTTFSGKSHIFGKSHQSRLRVVLLKFLEKVKEARRMLKKPQVEKFDCTLHDQKFWCYCCEVEVDRNVTDGNMTVLYAGLIEHMATPEHRKSMHKFWWENKADQKLKDNFVFSKEEIDRFKTEVEKALGTFVEKEDDFIKLEAEFIRNQERRRQEFLVSLTEVCLSRMQWQYPSNCFVFMYIWFYMMYTMKFYIKSANNFNENVVLAMYKFPSMKHCWLFLNQQQHNTESESLNEQHNGNTSTGDLTCGREREETVQQAGGDVVEVPYSAAGLTFIGHQDSSSCGNVHTGALPPWLQDDDDEDPLEGSSGSITQPEMGPSLQGFLKHQEQEKLKKLPPNRVGANFDHSSHTDANWLPSFGRVWNSGRRWQSRHQFRHEEGQKKRSKRKWDESTN